MRASALLVLLSIGLLPIPLEAADLVNVNTATMEELMTVEGIGETTAGKILQHRKETGRITSVQTLCSIRGVGIETETCQKIAAGVTFEETSDTSGQKESEDTSSASKEKNANAEPASPPRVPVTELYILAPEIAYVNQPVAFDVVPDGTGERLIRYAWNFGDGMTADVKSPMHAYQYPGRYVVFVKSRYLGEEVTARGELTVLPATLSLLRTENGDIELHNDAKYEIDLGGFTLQGEKSFTIPRHTILLSDATLTARRGLLETGSRGLVSVMDPAGTVIAAALPHESPVSYTEPAAAAARKQSAARLEEAELLDADLEPVTDALPHSQKPMVYRPEDTAAAGNARGFDYGISLPYLGVAGLLLAGIIGVYAKRRTEAHLWYDGAS